MNASVPTRPLYYAEGNNKTAVRPCISCYDVEECLRLLDPLLPAAKGWNMCRAKTMSTTISNARWERDALAGLDKITRCGIVQHRIRLGQNVLQLCCFKTYFQFLHTCAHTAGQRCQYLLSACFCQASAAGFIYRTAFRLPITKLAPSSLWHLPMAIPNPVPPPPVIMLRFVLQYSYISTFHTITLCWSFQ